MTALNKFLRYPSNVIRALALCVPSLLGCNLQSVPFHPRVDQGELQWSGAGCRQEIDNTIILVGRGLLESTRCASNRFDITAGHYLFDCRISATGLELSSKHHLDEVLSVQLRLFNSRGEELPHVGTTKFSTFDSSVMQNSLKGVTSDTLFTGGGSARLTLIPRFYPFDSGWIPEGAKSAEIVLTMNGGGTVSLSHLSLRPSKWNMSLRQRVMTTRRSFTEPILFPRPQHVAIQSRLVPLSNLSLCIVDHTNNVSTHKGVDRALIRFMAHLIDLGIQGTIAKSSCKSGDVRIEFSNLQNGDPKDPEGYAVDSTVEKGLSLRARTPRGFVYALNMASQMFGKEGPHVGMWEGTIRDFPTTHFRAASGKDVRDLNFADELSAPDWYDESRLNYLFLEAETHDLRWWIPEPKVISAAEKLSARSKHEGLFELGVLINPYIHRADPKIEKHIQYSTKEFQKEFYGSISRFLRSGVTSIILRADDFVPHLPDNLWSYVIEDQKDRSAVGTLGRLHSKMVTDVWSRIQREFPGTKVFFVPPWYARLFVERSNGAGEEYASELARGVPEGVTIMWTGPAVRSLSIDSIEAQYFSGLYGNRKLMMWDNSLYARRHDDFWGKKVGRIHLNSSIEPYDVDIEDLNSTSFDGMFVNAQMTELMRVQLATVGAYLWNPTGYSPEEALWSYLVIRFGEIGADLVLKIDEELWSIKESLAAGRSSEVALQRGVTQKLITELREKVPAALALAAEYQQRVETAR